MRLHVITLFPEFFVSPLQASLTGKAIDKGILQVELLQLREFAVNSYGKVDDAPYGGGQGMVLMVEPIDRAVASIRQKEKTHVILLTPRGERFNQKTARRLLELSAGSSLTFICGHYEGVDERVAGFIADESLSVGDFVLSGGEPAALLLIDSLSRLLPGYMGNAHSPVDESHETEDYIEFPHYTRPADYQGHKVPDILLSGNHALISKWRREQGLSAFQKLRFVPKQKPE